MPGYDYKRIGRKLKEDDCELEFYPDKKGRPLLPGDFMILKELIRQNPNRYSGNVVPTEVIKSIQNKNGNWDTLLREI